MQRAVHRLWEERIPATGESCIWPGGLGLNEGLYRLKERKANAADNPDVVISFVVVMGLSHLFTVLPDLEAQELSQPRARPELMRLWVILRLKVESLAAELLEKPESKDQDDGSLQRSLGVFQHGGVVGLSTLSPSNPELVQKVCQLIRRDHPLQVKVKA